MGFRQEIDFANINTHELNRLFTDIAVASRPERVERIAKKLFCCGERIDGLLHSGSLSGITLQTQFSENQIISGIMIHLEVP